MFIAGMKWGEVKQEISAMKVQIARIEGMFEMRLKDQK
jgi:hypothetical protein